MGGVSNSEIVSVRRMLRLVDARLRKHVDADYLQDLLKQIEGTVESLIAAQHALPEKTRFDMLYEVTQVLGTSLDLQTVLEQVMDVAIQLTGAEDGFLMLLDDDGTAETRVARRMNRTNITTEEVNYSRTIVNFVLDRRKSVLTSNAAEDPRFDKEASVVKNALLSIMAVPLWARGNVIGVAYVENQLVAGLFSKEDLAVMETISAQAAIAIDNAMLFNSTDQALNQRVTQLRELRRIDQKLNAILDFDTAAHYLLETACRIAQADEAWLAQKQDNDGAIVQRVGYTSAEGTVEPMVVYSQLHDVWKSGQLQEFAEDGQNLLALPVSRDQDVLAIILLQRKGLAPYTDEQRDMLERLVLRAAVTLDNARLYSEIKAANLAKSEFVGIVAHDLKAPMSTILGNAELIALYSNSLATDKITQYAQRISKTVDRMNALVSDLADISRIESGNFSIDNRSVDVYEVVEVVKDTVKFDVEAREHSWIQDMPDDLPKVWVDYYRLLQVLINLVTNAYKYTPNGGEICLSVAKKGPKLVFTVSDTGVGLSPEQLEKLGTKFWRSHDDHARAQPGTGLGFAISQMIVEKMGSTITVESEKGKGSTFSFAVPIATPGHKVSGVVQVSSDSSK